MLTKVFSLSAIYPAKDCWIYRWKKENLQPGSFFNVTGGYEDRDSWVRDALATKSHDELMQSISKTFAGDVCAVLIGQEKCRSSGIPIRFIRVYFLIP